MQRQRRQPSGQPRHAVSQSSAERIFQSAVSFPHFSGTAAFRGSHALTPSGRYSVRRKENVLSTDDGSIQKNTGRPTFPDLRTPLRRLSHSPPRGGSSGAGFGSSAAAQLTFRSSRSGCSAGRSGTPFASFRGPFSDGSTPVSASTPSRAASGLQQASFYASALLSTMVWSLALYWCVFFMVFLLLSSAYRQPRSVASAASPPTAPGPALLRSAGPSSDGFADGFRPVLGSSACQFVSIRAAAA